MRKNVNENEVLSPEEEMNKKDNEITVYKLISSIFQNNLKKEEIIKKHRPCFSLKVIPNREIDKVYSTVEKIPVEKIDLVEEFKYEEEKFESKDIFEANSKSFGLSNFDVDLSVNIFGHKQEGEFHQGNQQKEITTKRSTKIHCIHTIFISLFRTIIDFKDIKLAKQIYEELKDVEDANATDKKKLLKKLIDKFGLYIPLELVIGGRMNISFVANNDEEKNMYHSIIQKDINAKLGGGFSFISAKLGLNFNSTKNNYKSSQSLESIQNMTTKIIGGDYLYKNDLKNWIKSFNTDNLQVIEYKTLIPIYCFIPGFENKLKICLESYDDIVLQQIYNLIENDFKNNEDKLYEGCSLNNNSWKVGIVKNFYNSFAIEKKRTELKVIITKNKNNYKKKKTKSCLDFNINSFSNDLKNDIPDLKDKTDNSKSSTPLILNQIIYPNFNNYTQNYISKKSKKFINASRNSTKNKNQSNSFDLNASLNSLQTNNDDLIINSKKEAIINDDNRNIIKNCDNLYICGEVPDGYIICGWDISTNVNSKPYNIVCSWKRKKELRIIGSRYFKFKLDINIPEKTNISKDIEIKWFLDIFYINSDYLSIYSNENSNNISDTVILLLDEYKLNNIIPSKTNDFNIISKQHKNNTPQNPNYQNRI